MRSVTRALARHIGRRAGGRRGMTLIEVMVAAMILLVAMAGIVPFFVTGLTQSSTIRMRSIATNLAREKMEQIRQLDYREIYTDAMKAVDASLGTRTLESLFGTNETVRDSDFTVSYQVNNQAYQEGTLKEVTVNVTWDAPPTVSPASLTTLVHQQFLGPRGSALEVISTDPDPLGSPFRLIRNTNNTTVKYFVAQADWALIFYDLSAATPAARNVYMRLAMVDDDGQAIPIGDPADQYMIDKSAIRYTQNASDQITAVWFEYSFDEATIPDGYWECRAVCYNEYNEPGNTWRLRLRVEKADPTVPTGLVATPQAGDDSIVLNWLSGPDRDRSHWVIQRRKWDYSTTSWFPWVTVVDGLNPKLTTYEDTGDVASGTDPWGDAGNINYYEYSLWAVDKCDPGNAGPATQAQTYIPDMSTTTTSLVTTTTSVAPTSSTTTTTSLVAVSVQNNTGTSYTVTFVGAHATYTFSAKKNKTTTVDVISGDWYMVTVEGGGLPGSFLAGSTLNPVYTIN